MQTPTITESKMAFNKIDEKILIWNSFFPLHRKYKKLQNTSYSIRKVIMLPYKISGQFEVKNWSYKQQKL